MTKVVPISVKHDPLAGLKRMVESIESGETDITDCDCTVILGTDIYHFGTHHDGEAAMGAVWNCTFAIHKLMGRAVREVCE